MAPRLIHAGVLATLVVGLSGALNAAAWTTSEPQAVPGSQTVLQRCVDEWNLMNPTRFGATIAAVNTRPRCTVTVAHTYSPVPGMSCSRGDETFPGPRRLCLARGIGFICQLNQYGAYACPEHGGTISVATWNARLTNARTLVLDQPPHSRPVTTPPAWVTQYRHKDGFIIPWIGTTGRLQKGLILTGSYDGPCAGASDATTAPTAIRCYGSTKVFDPCFPPTRNWATGHAIAACAEAPGSTHFVRFRISRAV